MDAQREELEAEFFARYDADKWNYSALDPLFELACDDYPEPGDELVLPVLPQEPEWCPDCLSVPF